MYKFGIELEGFRCRIVGNSAANVIIPLLDDPVDGFPGLVELRSVGGRDLAEAMGEIEERALKLTSRNNVNFLLHKYKFSGEDMSLLRKSRRFNKDQLDVQNVYGKKPKRFANWTIASVQLNVSKLVSAQYTQDGKTWPARYALFNFLPFIKAMDKEFAAEIDESGRQPGMYAIKDDIRIEYRSLPNFAYYNDFYQRVMSVVSTTLNN